MRRGTFKDITGRKFHRLTARRMVGYDRFRNALWECECDCGEIVIVSGCALRRHNTKSCGCWKHDEASQRMRVHGLGGDLTYRSWVNMIRRCFNPADKRYDRYGGRGISVCEMFRASPVNLIAVIGPRPYGLTIHRIDNDGHYSCGQCAECSQRGWPMNVKWATYIEQARNTSLNVMIEYRGRTQCIQAWADELNIPFTTIRARALRHEDLVNPPIRGRVLEIDGRRQSIRSWAAELRIPYGTFYHRFTHGQVPEAREVV